MRDLANILTKFQKIVSPDFCNSLSKECQLVQRSSSRLLGYEFAQAMMIPNAFLEAESLNSLAVRMRTVNKRCNLSASALAQRINTPAAERFMKACFGKVLREIVRSEVANLSDLPNLSCFKRVLIQDSSRAELHSKLSSYFKGSGGVASEASVKLDYIFDYVSEQFVNIEFYSGNTPDQSLANRLIPLLERGDLVIRDLGYFIINSLKAIGAAGAYFVSRWKVNEYVYANPEDREPFDLARFLEERIVNGVADVIVYIGKERHPVRLIACRMSEEAENKRLRTANRSAQRHGIQMSAKKKVLLKYNIFISNVCATVLSAVSVMALYRARWRIENIFKQWKSCLKIHLFKGYNERRILCFLYGRLIMILLLGSMCPFLMRYAWEQGRELSCYKVTNYVIADHVLSRAIQENKLEEFIQEMLEDIPRRLCMDKRRRLSLRENVRMGIGYCDQWDCLCPKQSA